MTTPDYRASATWFSSGAWTPTVGQAVDRLSILYWKQHYAPHLETVRDEIRTIEAWITTLTLSVDLLPFYRDLLVLNGAIWHATGQVRKQVTTNAFSYDSLGKQYVSIFHWNEQRMVIIQQLNTALMGTTAPEEKV